MTYQNYYINQAGSGIQGYQAFKSQRGKGIFGTLWRNIAWPFLKYAGKKALNIGLDVGKDAAYGMYMKDSIKSRAKEHGAGIIDDLATKVKSVLSGRGKRIRKRRNITRRKTKKGTQKRRKRNTRRRKVKRKSKTGKKKIKRKKRLKRRKALNESLLVESLR